MAKRHQEGRGSKPTKGPVSRKVLKVSSADSIRLRVDPVGHERAEYMPEPVSSWLRTAPKRR